MNNGTFINGPGQTGTIVGTFQSALGMPYYGFQQNTPGNCTTISVPGATLVEATGINNSGDIVGYFEGSDGAWHGFLLNHGKSPIQIDYNYNGQTAAATYLHKINDAGQIVGYAYSPSTFYYQSFIYYRGQFYPVGISGEFTYTLAYGINGDATLTGIYYFQPVTEDFELSATPPSWGGTVIGLTPGGSANTDAEAINANGELAGLYYTSACTNPSGECAFVWTGGFLLTLLQYGGNANVAYGMNDFGQVVGPYTDSTTSPYHGSLWVHQ